MVQVVSLLLIASAVYYWWSATRAKEVAIHAGMVACERAQVQFLDHTVEQRRVALRRDKDGLCWCRYYVFEFTVDGGKRYEGRVITMRHRVVSVDMDVYRLPDNVTRLHP